MSNSSIIIAIDGFSSTGKSSFARLIAKTYGLLYLDSGALYRAVTLFAMENHFMEDGRLDISGITPFLGDLNIHFKYSPVDGSSLTYMGGRNIEADIRSMAVAANVSPVATERVVRSYVDNILHEYGRKGGVIMDGRDIGTTVFPNADLKIFMTASMEVRALRRATELRAKGEPCDVEQVSLNLQERDYIDSHREASPLAKADDAIVLDNTDMTLEDQMVWIGEILKTRFGILPL